MVSNSFSAPISQACTQTQFATPEYAHWCRRLGIGLNHHRKNWEWCYIMQVLARSGMLAPGRRGVGFAVGSEPLPDLIASFGPRILATDLEPERAKGGGWVDTNQHAANIGSLKRGHCSDEEFNSRITFQYMDMNAIPDDLTNYDFTWSACALEHLGSIAHGLAFIERSLDVLVPGGVAVHTTELNCSSDTETIDHNWCVLFRQSDFRNFAEKLTAKGHHIELSFDLGDLPSDKFVDVPPYKHDPHLKLQLEGFATTSYGLYITKSHDS